jgi:hypothetical protein
MMTEGARSAVLETAETAEQVQSLVLLEHPALGQREAVAAVRRLSQPLADGVNAVLPEILRREGW